MTWSELFQCAKVNPLVCVRSGLRQVHHDRHQLLQVEFSHNWLHLASFWMTSSIAIAAEDPVDEDNPRNYYLGKIDYVFTITFACEVCLKVNQRATPPPWRTERLEIWYFADPWPRVYPAPRVLHAWLLERDGHHRGLLLHGLLLPHHRVSGNIEMFVDIIHWRL